MSSSAKTILKFGSVNATSAQTVIWPTLSDAYKAKRNNTAQGMFIFNVTSLAGGTTPSLSIAIQEYFSDAFVTVDTSTVNATGASVRSSEFNTDGRAAIGKGVDTKVIITPSGSPTGAQVDIYHVMWND